MIGGGNVYAALYYLLKRRDGLLSGRELLGGREGGEGFISSSSREKGKAIPLKVRN